MEVSELSQVLGAVLFGSVRTCYAGPADGYGSLLRVAAVLIKEDGSKRFCLLFRGQICDIEGATNADLTTRDVRKY